MSDINSLYDRNHRFAVGFDQADLAIRPRCSTVILTCIDARVDPAHFLDLKLGDAVVLRNPGGRVTEAVERELAILFAIANQVNRWRAARAIAGDYSTFGLRPGKACQSSSPRSH